VCDAGKDDSGGRGEKGSYLVAGVGVPDEEFGAGEDVGGREVGLLFVQRGGGVHSGGGGGGNWFTMFCLRLLTLQEKHH